MKKTTIFAPLSLIVIAAFFASDGRLDSSPKVSAAGDVGPVGPAKKMSPPTAVGHPTFVSPHAHPIAVRDGQVFVANTPADTLDIIDAATRKLVARVNVGIDPVGVALRPDGKEVWVSNHVSDSVSVVDNDKASPTYLHVIATVQDLDPLTKATRFDEPVGIAFASNDKAYVALSSENTVAVIDVATKKVVKRLEINAQDPRAIVVRGGRLYVIPFESNNKTQLSGGNEIDGDLVTFNAWEHSIIHNNVLSLGHVVDIVKHPKVPDRDLFVFDTSTDTLIETVDTLGTLLYGLAVDSNGRVFIAQTDARNDVNGRSGTKKHGLKELGNRAFLNQITMVNSVDAEAVKTNFFDLEPLPPEHPERGMALATPFAIEVTSDDSILVATAAGSDKLFTVDAATGKVLGRADVGAVPRGIALAEDAGGKVSQAWVLNAVANTVSLVDFSDVWQPKTLDTIELHDPTHPVVKRGRGAFETAAASTTKTVSSASCHPDGHTDQLLWVLKTPIVTGGDQIMPRSTMPIRGLRDTAPFHWDGIPGDPYGGNNSAKVHGSDPPNSDPDNPASSARHLIDGGIAATMSLVGDDITNDEGKAGALSAAERDAMATFLLNVPYPPAQRRAYTNTVSQEAKQGFRLFHIDGDHDEKPKPNVCGNCHRMPFLVSTNTPRTGMDAPTWRGAYDRFLILPQGRLNIIDFDFYERVAERGQPERDIWQFSWGGRRRFDPVWKIVLEGSTGYSGAFGRQVTLNKTTANHAQVNDLLAALEVAARDGAIVLEADGVMLSPVATVVKTFDDKRSNTQPKLLTSSATTGPTSDVALQFIGGNPGAAYVNKFGQRSSFTRERLISLAANGEFVGTFTARHGASADIDHPQPAIWTLGPIEQQRGRQEFPILYEGNHQMKISGRHVDGTANVIVDGRRVPGLVAVKGDETMTVTIPSLPESGMHLLQLQNPNGLFSNDFIFHVTSDAIAAEELSNSTDTAHVDIRDALHTAIVRGDLEETKALLNRAPQRINEQRPIDGSTPLSTASLHGKLEIAELLLKRRANVNATNRNGNTPLRVAAFLCRKDIVELLLKHDASIDHKSHRGEIPFDVVKGEWNQPLADFYEGMGRAISMPVDLQQIQKERPAIAELLQTHRDAETK